MTIKKILIILKNWLYVSEGKSLRIISEDGNFHHGTNDVAIIIVLQKCLSHLYNYFKIFRIH